MKQSQARKHLWLTAGVVFLFVLIIAVIFGLKKAQESLSVDPEKDIIFQQPSVLYLSPMSGISQIWRSSLDGTQVRQISHSESGVTDYAVSPDGKRVVFSVLNQMQGNDLWISDGNGNDQRELFTCETDLCYGFSWSSNSVDFAYVREFERKGESVSSVVYLYSIEKTAPITVFPKIQAHIEEISISPDGSRLAIYDPEMDRVRVWDLNSLSEITLDANFGLVGVWYPDSIRMLVGRVGMYKAGRPVVTLYIVDLNTLEIMPLKALNNLDLDISQPVISRDGNWIALSARDAENVVTKQVWVMDADGNLVEVVTKESNYTHASVRWDPEGKYLVYQRFNVNSSDSLPEVWLWSREESSRWMLASDAALPKWYP